jgi:hypothetical protein
MKGEGVERTILSLATPFINYHLDGTVVVKAARRFNDSLASAIAANSDQFGAWAFLPMQNPAEFGNGSLSIWEPPTLLQGGTDGDNQADDENCRQHAEPFCLYGHRCERGTKNAECCRGDAQNICTCLWRRSRYD